jgi:hypothetical protein
MSWQRSSLSTPIESPSRRPDWTLPQSRVVPQTKPRGATESRHKIQAGCSTDTAIAAESAKDAETIAKTPARKSVSPKGIGSGIRMLQYFVNHSGKELSPRRKKELEKAKHLMQARTAK